MTKKKNLESKMPKMITAADQTHTPIDDLIGGGIREDEVIELYGEYGVGKTQLALTLHATHHDNKESLSFLLEVLRLMKVLRNDLQ